MRFTEIGQQLRAYRLESGMRAEEIATRLGVSRAALYRYEKGEVIKLDTIQRLAELLKISPLSLLGIGVEYYSRPIGYFERLRQIEETADQLLIMEGSLFYLTTTPAYDAALSDAFHEAATEAGSERAAAIGVAEQVMGILAARKRMYGMRRPGVICMVSAQQLRQFLSQGVGGTATLSATLRQQNRRVAAEQVVHVAALMEAEPMGLQFGVLPDQEPTSNFVILRSRDRANVAINPFLPDSPASQFGGVAMLTAADEAIAAHQRVAEAQWREALKGAAGAARLREIVGAAA